MLSAAFVVAAVGLGVVLTGCGSGTTKKAGSICASFTYSDWGPCVGGTRTRTVLTSSPAACTGGSPFVAESCGGVPDGGLPGVGSGSGGALDGGSPGVGSGSGGAPGGTSGSGGVPGGTSATGGVSGVTSGGGGALDAGSASGGSRSGGASGGGSRSGGTSGGGSASGGVSGGGSRSGGASGGGSPAGGSRSGGSPAGGSGSGGASGGGSPAGGSRNDASPGGGGASGGDAPVADAPSGATPEGEAPGGGGTDYHVGEGQAYKTLGAVPWYRLQPGDTVYVHPGTYHERILISASGTESQWIRVRGIPDANGNLPIISGANATTSTNNHWRWQNPDDLQAFALVAVAISDDTEKPPHYVEIANLQIQDATPSNSFTAENGTTASYADLAACIYAKSPVHLLVRDNILTNCGWGFFDWTGPGVPPDEFGSELAADIVLRNNYLYNNGPTHQVYTEADGVIIEGNRFGPGRAGSYGNHIKDRSAGTVIRYNYFEEAPESGYTIDLPEPEAGCPSLCYSFGNPTYPNPKYLQTFIYGNLFIRSNSNENFIHWNEDHYAGRGRALEPNGRLYFYHNTIVDTSGLDFLFIEHEGGHDCPDTDLPGRIDFRNNLLYSTAGNYKVGEYCYGRPAASYVHGNWDFGVNWISPTWNFAGSSSTGRSSVVPSTGNAPGFLNLASKDYRLADGASSGSIGGALAPAVTSNSLGLDLTPTKQYVLPDATLTPKMVVRAHSGSGSDLGAFER